MVKGKKAPITVDIEPMMGEVLYLSTACPDGIVIGLWLEASKCLHHLLASHYVRSLLHSVNWSVFTVRLFQVVRL